MLLRHEQGPQIWKNAPLGESFLEKMEISESLFGKNHGKLAHWRNVSPKIIYEEKHAPLAPIITT
jgi:hypothetical protein